MTTTWNPLLQRQIKKHLSGDFMANEQLLSFINAVNNSYNSYEKDRTLSLHAFKLSEQEYLEINKQLKEEITLKQKSIQRLKEAVETITDLGESADSDNLLLIAEHINKEVVKRRNAEKIYTSLIVNLQSGVLLENDSRHIICTNQLFCDMFNIPASPEALQGADCSDSAEQTKHLFKNPDEFVKRINELLDKKQLCTNDILELVDGRILERDYIPIYLDEQYSGHLWNYRDITERKITQDNLIQSELKNRLIMNSALDAIITIDIGGVITFCNSQAEKIFGWEPGEMLRKKLSETIIPQKYRDAHNRGMEHYQKTGKGPVLNKQIEITAIRKDGEEFPIELSIVPVTQNQEVFFCSFIRDISERKHNEKTLKESEQRWKFALEGSGDGIWDWDIDTGEVFFSKQWKAMLGYDEDEIKGSLQEWEKIVHPDDLQQVYHDLDKHLKGDTSVFTNEHRMLCKDGTYKWVLARGMVINRSDNNMPLRVIGTHTDITNKKTAEEVLRINEEKFRSIITNMNLGLVEVDLDDNIMFTNQSFCEMSGYEQEELIGRKASEMFLKGENLELVNKKNELRKHAISDAYEVSIKNKRGQQRWWLISGAPRYNDKHELIGSIGIHLDITEQKKLEYELIQAREHAEDSARAKEFFLTNMSHEIRTPMNAILGMSRQLQKTNLDQQQRFYLNVINSASENLLVIINDILDISKIEAGKLSLEHIIFQLKEVVARSVQVMVHKAEEKGICLNYSIAHDTHQFFVGDPYRLNQVLLNLISNSIKFTEKGSVDVNCHVKHDDQNHQIIVIQVKDTGVGMDKEFLGVLFQKFIQEDKSIARKYGGTGLGMSITKHLVELMNGEIQVESEKGKGTLVHLTIPFAKGVRQEADNPIDSKFEVGILKDKKILLVEDNEMNRLVAITILKNYGAVITEANNGLEAIETLKKGSYDLILMDMQMPLMGGIEATEKIRKEIDKSIPIIALTANAIKGESDKCLAAGMNDYIAKPFDEEELIKLIAGWLGKEAFIQSHYHKKQDHLGQSNSIPPLYNLNKLREMSRNNEDFVRKMTGLFVKQLPISIQDIKTAYETNDIEKVRAIAHRIKPSIDSMGISLLREDIRNIEATDVENYDKVSLKELIDKVDQIINEVIEQLKIDEYVV